MEAKTIEIRDHATFVPALAVQLEPRCEGDHHLFARSGYGLSPEQQGERILLINLDSCRCENDPLAWNDRTMSKAHELIVANWSDIESGAVVDVAYALGDRDEPCESERGRRAAASTLMRLLNGL